MQDRLIISLEEFPEEGLHLRGELNSSVFDIDTEALRCTGPLVYDLEVRLFDTELMLRGTLSAAFSLRCDRCLQYFDYVVTVEDFTLSEEVKGKIAFDATEFVREDIILELPAYPKCELADRECEINDTFGDFRLDKDPTLGVDSATPSGNSVWDALDQFPGK